VAQITKKTAAFQTELATLMEKLKAQFKQENEKLVINLPERFEASGRKLREKFNSKLHDETQDVSDRVDILNRDTAHDIDN